MAYAAYTSTAANTPFLMAPNMGSAKRFWAYTSTHTSTEITAAGFFTDGYALGMQLGDMLTSFGSTTYAGNHYTVIARTTTGVTVSTGTLFST